MKKSLSVILSLIIILTTLGALPFTARADDSGVCGDGVTYTYNSENKRLTISGNGNMYDYDGSMPQPWYSYRNEVEWVNVDKGVTYIGNSAFSSMANLNIVDLPKGLLEIGKSAFYDVGYSANWLALSIPSTVTRIGSHAFAKTKLSSITLYQGLQYVGVYAFANTKLTEVYIPPSVKYIGGRAFGAFTENDRDYETVEGFTIRGIGTNNCAYNYAQSPGGIYGTMTALNYVDVSSGTTGGCSYAFDIETGTLTVSKSGDGRMSGNGAISNRPWYYYRTEIKSIIINEGVVYIGPNAFNYCEGATTVSLPESLLEIDECAFSGCAIKSIKFPSNLTTIGDYAFLTLPNLTSITLPDKLETIGRWAFFGCTNLKSVTIPSSVKSIGAQAFGYDNFKIMDGFTINSACNNATVKAYMDNYGTDSDGNKITWKKSHNYDAGKITKTTAAKYTKTFTCKDCGTKTTKTYNKKANTLTAKGKTKTLKYKTLKKKSISIKRSNAITVSKAKGAVTYKKSSGNKKITVAKNGKITVKKGLKKGTYKVKIKVAAAGTNTYKAKTITVTVTIKVK